MILSEMVQLYFMPPVILKYARSLASTYDSQVKELPCSIAEAYFIPAAGLICCCNRMIETSRILLAMICIAAAETRSS